MRITGGLLTDLANGETSRAFAVPTSGLRSVKRGGQTATVGVLTVAVQWWYRDSWPTNVTRCSRQDVSQLPHGFAFGSEGARFARSKCMAQPSYTATQLYHSHSYTTQLAYQYTSLICMREIYTLHYRGFYHGYYYLIQSLISYHCHCRYILLFIWSIIQTKAFIYLQRLQVAGLYLVTLGIHQCHMSEPIQGEAHESSIIVIVEVQL